MCVHQSRQIIASLKAKSVINGTPVQAMSQHRELAFPQEAAYEAVQYVRRHGFSLAQLRIQVATKFGKSFTKSS